MKQKAQITVFIVIGMLVIISFGVTIYVGNQMKKGTETKGTAQKTEQIDIQPIQDYITTCLTLATEDGLALIGKQGGVIYQSQGGITPEPKTYMDYTENDITYKVSYMILPPQGNVGHDRCETEYPFCLFYSEPMEYPYPGFPYPQGETKPYFKGFYGINQIPPLYKSPEATNSIQENLETYITKKTMDCTSWEKFEDKGYTIKEGAAKTTLTFAEQQRQFIGEKYLTAELEWPIDITTPTGDNKAIANFNTRIQVRLATIYYTVKELIDSDVTDIEYKPANKDSFKLTTKPYGKDSFISVQDTQSLTAGKPFEFLIPRKNRAPALWKLETNQLTLGIAEERRSTLSIEGSKLLIYNPCPDDGPTSTFITLQASDPDEEQASFEVEIPGSATDKIPKDAMGEEHYKITIKAKDKAGLTDYERIPTRVKPCIPS